MLVGGKGQGVNSGDDRIGREVSAPVVPLLLQLDQAEQVLPTSGRCSSRPRSAARSARQLTAKRAAGSARNTFPLGNMTGAKRCTGGAGEKKPEMKCSQARCAWRGGLQPSLKAPGLLWRPSTQPMTRTVPA